MYLKSKTAETNTSELWLPTEQYEKPLTFRPVFLFKWSLVTGKLTLQLLSARLLFPPTLSSTIQCVRLHNNDVSWTSNELTFDLFKTVL